MICVIFLGLNFIFVIDVVRINWIVGFFFFSFVIVWLIINLFCLEYIVLYSDLFIFKDLNKFFK